MWCVFLSFLLSFLLTICINLVTTHFANSSELKNSSGQNTEKKKQRMIVWVRKNCAKSFSSTSHTVGFRFEMRNEWNDATTSAHQPNNMLPTTTPMSTTPTEKYFHFWPKNAKHVVNSEFIEFTSTPKYQHPININILGDSDTHKVANEREMYLGWQ